MKKKQLTILTAGAYTSIIEYDHFAFSGGEPHIKLKRISDITDRIKIVAKITSFNDLGFLLVANDALERTGKIKYKELYIPYFPGARQDRVCVEGEPLTVKVYADIINSMKFDKVTILDPHSDVTPALINNCEVLDNHEFVFETINSLASELSYIDPSNHLYTRTSEYQLISPDAGSSKKISKLAQQISSDNSLPGKLNAVINCEKTRDLETGKLSGFKVNAKDLKGLPCIIVDDICDGGGTFIGLAEELKKKGAGDLYLLVTHGIFSKGQKELKKYFKGIYTTNSILTDY